MDYFTKEEYSKFLTYKHSAPPTIFEEWIKKKFLNKVEQSLPARFSANTITMLGQLGPLISTLLLMSYSLSFKSEAVPWYIIVIGGALTEWFSVLDMMDGMRARRVKCGSPLGRIVDEGLDMLAYVFIGVLCAYACRVNPLILTLAFGFQNAPFYAMELKHILLGHLVMKLGEFGNVEAELMYSSIMAIIGFIGPDKFQYSIGSLFGTEYSDYFYGINCAECLTFISILLQGLLLIDNVQDSFRAKPSQTLKGLLPILFHICIAVATMHLPSATEESVINYMMTQFSFANVCLDLMLLNMAGKKMGLISLEQIVPFIPAIAYYLVGVEAQTEILLTRGCCGYLFVRFLMVVYLVAIQYGRESKQPFFTIKVNKD